jgi:hypothetical protein
VLMIGKFTPETFSGDFVFMGYFVSGMRPHL